jgi:hypothetical protein
MIEKRKAGRPPSVDGETSFLHIRCRPSEKAMWVKSGQNKGGLSKWVKKTLNEAAQVRCESGIESMFEQAVRTLAAIDDALGIGDDGCCDPDQTLTAIADLKEAARRGEALACAVMTDQVGHGGHNVELTSNEAVQVRCEAEIASILDDLRTEADLCRNETADDIANLLDSAANEIEHLRSDVGELAMLVKRFAQSLLKAAPEHDLPSKALDYLRRARLCGSPLREE